MNNAITETIIPTKPNQINFIWLPTQLNKILRVLVPTQVQKYFATQLSFTNQVYCSQHNPTQVIFELMIIPIPVLGYYFTQPRFWVNN